MRTFDLTPLPPLLHFQGSTGEGRTVHKTAAHIPCRERGCFFMGCVCKVIVPMDEERKEKLYRKHKRRFTKLLRRRMTPAEKTLWTALRNRKLQGSKFRRQVNVGPYIADFFSWEHRLIVEVDGGVHDEREEYDEERDTYFYDRRFKVVRIRNEEVLHNLNSALQKIQQTIEKAPSPCR